MEEEYDSSTRGDYITLKEASAHTPYSQEYLGLLARSGKIEAKKFGRNWRVRRGVVERYYKEHREDIEKFGKSSRQVSSQGIRLTISGPKIVAIGIGWSFVLIIAGYALANSPSPSDLREIALREVNNIYNITTSKALSARNSLADTINDVYIEASDSISDYGYSLKISYLSANSSVGGSLASAYNSTLDGLAEFNKELDSFSLRSVITVRSFGENLLSEASDSFTAGAIVAEDSFAELSDVLYNSSFSSAQAGKASYVSTSSQLQAGIVSVYKNLNQKISSFFGSTYLKVVEQVIPGYSPGAPSPLGGETFSQLSEELEKTRQELQQLKEEGLIVKEVTKEVQRVTQIQPVKEITREVIKVDDTKLLSIQGDLSLLQQDLATLTATVSSSNLSFTNSRLGALESFIINQNRTVAVSPTNTTQIKYLLDNISAISLELNTNSDRVGLLVNQRGTENIIVFQDNGEDILTIADGGATTLSSTLSVTGIATFSNATTSFNGVPYSFPSADGSSGFALSTNGAGQLSWSQAGVNDATYVTLSTNASLTDERVLTGTTNQITITDNGAGSTIVLSTPQDIAITSSPTFTALTATTTLTINHTNSGDPILQFQDNTTDTWYLGFDNSDANKFRITPALGASSNNFNATSSGITINSSGFVGIGTTNPTVALTVTGAATISTTLSVNSAVFAGGTDTFNITNGSASFDVAASSTLNIDANLTVEGASILNQDLTTDAAVTFATIDTGQGANELYDMDQNVLTTSSPTFLGLTATTLTATTTLTINHTNSGDPYINFEDAGTDTWYLGFDNSDADKFRITPGGLFNATSSGITINLAGFVGIGTTNPGKELDVVRESSASALRIISYSDTEGDDGSLHLIHIRGSEDSPTATQAGDQLGRIQAGGFTTALKANKIISFEAGAEWGTAGDASDEPTRILFWTVPDGSGGSVERMRIDSIGNVGIGTASPSHILTVSSADTASTTLAITNTGNGDPIINFIDNGTERWYLGYDDSDANKFRITPAGLFNATSSGITINAAGFVGIGTTNPTVALTVTGAATISSTLGVTGIATFSNASTSFNGIEYGFPSDNGDASQVLTTDGTGVLSWAAASSPGLFTDGGATTYLTSLTDDLALGSSTANGPFLFDVSASLLTINHSSGDPSIAFQTASTTRWLVGVDDSQSGDPFRIARGSAFNATSSGITLDINGNVGIGTTGPDRTLDVFSASSPQLRITQSDNTEYSDFQVAASTGDLTVSASGEDIFLIQDPAGTTGANLFVCEGAACSSISIASRVAFITSGTTTTAWGSATDAGGNILPENAIIFDNEYILIPGTENATSVLMMFGPSSSTAPIIIFDQVVP